MAITSEIKTSQEWNNNVSTGLDGTKLLARGIAGLISVLLMISTAAAHGRLPTISYHEFLSLFKRGQPIIGKIIPASFIDRALAASSNFKNAKLDIRDSIISGTLLRPTIPKVPLTQALGPLQTLLAGRTSFSPVNIEIRFTHTRVCPQLTLPNLVFEKQVSFVGSDLSQELDLSGSIFLESLNVEASVLRGDLNLSAAAFLTGGSFSDTTFRRQINFFQVKIPENVGVSFQTNAFSGEVNFSESTIAGAVNFNEVHFLSPSFFNLLNQKVANLQGKLSFTNSDFKEQAYFDQSKVIELDLGDAQSHRPIVFKKGLTFAGSSLGTVVLRDALISGLADFSNSDFAKGLDLRWVVASDDLDFTGTALGSETRLTLRGARFQKTARFTWDQIENAVPDIGRGELLTLEENFRRLKDLRSQNQALYRRKLTTESGVLNWGSLIVWGYGVRPVFTLCWMAGAAVLFWRSNCALLVTNQRTRWEAAQVMGRAFKSQWPPFELTRGFWPGLLVVVEWGCFKILQILFLVALLNTTPFLKDFVPRVF